MPYNFFTDILELENINTGFKDFFEFSNIKNVTIFGAGQFGRFLAKELIKININITCYIENNSTQKETDNIPTVSIFDFDKYIDYTDLVILSISNLRKDFASAYDSIKDKYDGYIIAIDTLTRMCKVEGYAKIYSKYLKEKNIHPIAVHPYPLITMENLNLLESIISQLPLDSNILNSYLKFINKEVIDNNTDLNKYTEEIKCLKTKSVFYNGEFRSIDCKGEFVNVLNGKRHTTDNPKEYSQTIHCFGSSVIFGPGVEDKYTLPSCLQRKLKNNGMNKVLVNNYGIRGILLFSEKGQIKLYNTELNKNDIALLLADCDMYYYNKSAIRLIKSYYEKIFSDNNILYIDLYDILNNNHASNIYIDQGHFNFKANEIIADEIYKKLIEFNYISKSNEIKTNIESSNYYSELKDYIDSLKQYNTNITGKIGSIVMNCNPFTNGHRYLIEHAASQVDYLYIFVVEEDKSFFKFSDRIKLVREGVKDIKNCAVIPSGKFIISALTFPEYFSKESNKNVVIDATSDLTVFSKHIAPALNINIRYVGEEPNCDITNSYNNSMKEILPKHNIELRVIERLNHNNSAISASTVRNLLKEKKFNDIKEIVPESTFNFLISNFK